MFSTIRSNIRFGADGKLRPRRWAIALMFIPEGDFGALVCRHIIHPEQPLSKVSFLLFSTGAFREDVYPRPPVQRRRRRSSQRCLLGWGGSIRRPAVMDDPLPLVVVGAGPHALALVTRLLEPTADSLAVR